MQQSELPLITLGIPVYNAADLIEHTLLSVLNQTYPHIEYLLIDDKGNSMDIVRQVVAAHPRHESVRIIDQGCNQGIAVARNTIVDQASGKYLFTMDCDDVITSDCIEILYTRMQEHPVDFVAASFVRVDLQGKEYPGCHYADTLIEGDGHPVARYRYEENKTLFVATWNKLYNLDFLRKYNIRCQPGHFNEDPWFTYQVVMNARSCRLLPDCTLRYTYNPQSVSGIAAAKGYSDKIASQYVEVQHLKILYIKELNHESFYRSLLTDIMFMSLYHAYRICISPQLESVFKRQCLRQLLIPKFVRPAHSGGKRTIRYVLLRMFFSLPLVVKKGMVQLSTFAHLKEKVHRWAHFKG